MKKIIKEFKDFAIRGNFIDMAVGIIIGGAFGTIVNSLVKDVIMPPLGLITGGIDFSDKVWILKQASESGPQISLNYGLFINSVISFLIVAWAIFVVIKQINLLKAKEEKKPEPKPTEPPADIKLLTEIRDILKNK
ncbi:MAG TPA: large-conductance mechanosensitive channel protein MscL [Candidatus Paceibacterota bacterium]|mgnify:CR=1 FL=1|nr:large-conductance mechanosensitive channel protein MscL [Candidatus Paceibacterota bacterium]HMP18821.1 large-conductance mechanosensitive channel protein MscL [Candidatus Paceibacterota bacterium]HMP85542.1 large-conductance mechanosensitive channel protein MscL [Candidatus Paceibacterota bacterium]